MKQKRPRYIEHSYDTFESPLGTLYLLFTGEILKGVFFKKPLSVFRKGKAPSLIKKELKRYFENGLEKLGEKSRRSKER